MPGYTYDGIATLKNRFGIRSAERLHAAEAEVVAARHEEFRQQEMPGLFNAAFLRQIHRHLFQDVYEWAGRTRNEVLVLEDGIQASEPVMRKAEGRPFAAGPQIILRLEQTLEGFVRQNGFKGLNRNAFCNQAAIAFAEVNGVHPFREGNGRTQRAFFRQMALGAGYSLDFGVVSRERMTAASIAAHENGDTGMFQRLFREISDPVRVAALRKAQMHMDKHGLDWRSQYMSTTEPGQTYRLTMAGIAGTDFMARTDKAILIGATDDLPDPPPRQSEMFVLKTPAAIRDVPELKKN